jgi:hypothetical protein
MAEKNLYNLQQWRGPHGLRRTVLARDPICVLCNKVWSTIADHIRPFRSGLTEQECWALFTSLSNLRGVCEACHNALGDKSIAVPSGQRLMRVQTKAPGIEVQTDHGIKFVASSLTQATLDAGLDPDEIKALLGNM